MVFYLLQQLNAAGKSVSTPAGVAGGTGSGAANLFDLNVKPSSQTLVAGSTGAGATFNFQGAAGSW